MGDGEVSSGQLESPCLIRDRLEFFKVERHDGMFKTMMKDAHEYFFGPGGQEGGG